MLVLNCANIDRIITIDELRREIEYHKFRWYILFN